MIEHTCWRCCPQSSDRIPDLDGPLISEILVQQARAFLESYLSRRTLSAHP